MLAAYSVVGNDSIQTLGTFLSSNEKTKWWILWFFSGTILTFTLVYGWFQFDGDVSYGRLSNYSLPDPFAWYYLLPPIILLLLTRTGIPVSTSFLILTFFNEKNLESMITKSVTGYLIALLAAFIIYLLVAKTLEKKFISSKITKKEYTVWSILQWFSTGFLWSQWLIQDFANIYVYLPRKLSGEALVISLVVLLLLLAYIIKQRGGRVQSIVKNKTNTIDIRSATIIDLIYGIILLYFKEINDVPMSTTWVFIGLLAGRELALNFRLGNQTSRKSVFKDLAFDFGKVLFGLIISILLVFVVKNLSLMI